jgi:methylated-DNA-[protein]-cysteine S-methyltransferase
MTTAEFLIRVPSPIGRLELTSDAEHVLSLSIENGGHLPLEDSPVRPSPVLEEAARQLDEYFNGSRTSFELPVAFLSGSTFQRSVWQRLSTLGFGEAISYGALGMEVGKPGSARAIGGAVGANPLPIIIGCHRVLASNGRITGYSGGEGVPTKAWLLDHEGIAHTRPEPRSGATAIRQLDDRQLDDRQVDDRASNDQALDEELELSGSPATQGDS